MYLIEKAQKNLCFFTITYYTVFWAFSTFFVTNFYVFIVYIRIPTEAESFQMRIITAGQSFKN